MLQVPWGLQVTSYKLNVLQVTCYKLHVTSCKLSYMLLVTSYTLQVVSYELRFTSYHPDAMDVNGGVSAEWSRVLLKAHRACMCV